MKLSCPSCGVNFIINPEIIPDGGQKARCPQCQAKFVIRKTVRSSTDTTSEKESPPIRVDRNASRSDEKKTMADTLTMTLTGFNVLRDAEPSICKAFRKRIRTSESEETVDEKVIRETALEIYRTMPLPFRTMVADTVFAEYCLENRVRLLRDEGPGGDRVEDTPPHSPEKCCPKCGADIVDHEECRACGIVFSKFKVPEEQNEDKEPGWEQEIADALLPLLHPGEKIHTVIRDMYGQPLVLTNNGLITEQAKGRRVIVDSDYGRFYFSDILQFDINPHLLGLVFEVQDQDGQITKFIIAEEKASRRFYEDFYPRLTRYLARQQKQNRRSPTEIQKTTEKPGESGTAGRNHP